MFDKVTKLVEQAKYDLDELGQCQEDGVLQPGEQDRRTRDVAAKLARDLLRAAEIKMIAPFEIYDPKGIL